MNGNNIVKYQGVLGTTVHAGDLLKFLPCNYGEYNSSQLQTVTDSDLEEATKDEKIQFIEREYPWDRVVKTHCIGEYQIIETDKGSFHLYINFKDSHHSYSSLDAALIGAVCEKYDGANERLSAYVCKALGVDI